MKGTTAARGFSEKKKSVVVVPEPRFKNYHRTSCLSLSADIARLARPDFKVSEQLKPDQRQHESFLMSSDRKKPTLPSVGQRRRHRQHHARAT